MLWRRRAVYSTSWTGLAGSINRFVHRSAERYRTFWAYFMGGVGPWGNELSGTFVALADRSPHQPAANPKYAAFNSLHRMRSIIRGSFACLLATRYPPPTLPFLTSYSADFSTMSDTATIKEKLAACERKISNLERQKQQADLEIKSLRIQSKQRAQALRDVVGRFCPVVSLFTSGW